MNIEIEMSRHQHLTIQVESIEEVKAFTCDGWEVDTIDGTPSVGTCEFCGLPVLESDDFSADEDGVVLHAKCVGEEQ